MNGFKKIRALKSGIDSHPVSLINGKSDIYTRILRWQITKMLYKSDGKEVEWINGRKLRIYPGRTSGVGNYYYGLLEYEPMSFLFHYLEKDDVFFDIGANVGVYSVLASGAGRIVAFEPAKDTYRILKQNINLNSMNNIEAINAGVGSKDGNMLFTKGRDTINHIVYDQDESVEVENIQIRSIDSFADESGIYPTAIKMDIEGAELEAIKGGYGCLKNDSCNVVIMEIFSDSEKTKMLENLGFKLYQYDPRKRVLSETSAEIAGNNGIYIKDIGKAKKRVSHGETIIYQGTEL